MSDVEVRRDSGGFAQSEDSELLRESDFVKVVCRTRFLQLTGKWSA